MGSDHGYECQSFVLVGSSGCSDHDEAARGLILNTGSISGHVGLKNQEARTAVERGRSSVDATDGDRVRQVWNPSQRDCLGNGEYAHRRMVCQANFESGGLRPRLMDAHPIGRIASAQEVAGFFTYLASDHAVSSRRDLVDGWRIHCAVVFASSQGPILSLRSDPRSMRHK